MGAVSSSTGCRLTPDTASWGEQRGGPDRRGPHPVGLPLRATGPRTADAALRGEDSATADKGVTGRRGKLALRRGPYYTEPRRPPAPSEGLGASSSYRSSVKENAVLFTGLRQGLRVGVGGGRGCALQGNSGKHFWLSQLKHLGGRGQGCCKAQDSTAQQVTSPKCHRAGWGQSVYAQSTAKSLLCDRPSTEHI